MKIALVHDDFMQWGGAERLVKAFAEIWPEAPIFTSLHGELRGGLSWLTTKDIHVSFLQKLPFRGSLYKFLFPLYPLAFCQFDFSDYDVVLTSSARFAHFVKVQSPTIHIAYLNSPARMWWEPKIYFENRLLRLILLPFLMPLRYWDKKAFKRIDRVIANSENVANKILKYLSREVDFVVHPFVTDPATLPQDRGDDPSTSLRASSRICSEEGFFLVVSRLVAWKRIDIVIEACNQLALPLVVIGIGPDRRRLQSLAGPTIQILTGLTDQQVHSYYQKCCALIHPQNEDFGITSLEAMSFGKPIVAYGRGGALETVIPGVTGEFFEKQTSEELVSLLRKFNPAAYDSGSCFMRAKEFSRERFVREISNLVEENYRCNTKPKNGF